jgi:hypothetical protein
VHNFPLNIALPLSSSLVLVSSSLVVALSFSHVQVLFVLSLSSSLSIVLVFLFDCCALVLPLCPPCQLSLVLVLILPRSCCHPLFDCCFIFLSCRPLLSFSLSSSSLIVCHLFLIVVRSLLQGVSCKESIARSHNHVIVIWFVPSCY